MSALPRVSVLLIDRRNGGGGQPTLAAWHEHVAAEGLKAEMAVTPPGPKWWVEAMTRLGLEDDDPVLVCDLSSVPGIGMLGRLLECRAEQPGAVIDARVLPVEITLDSVAVRADKDDDPLSPDDPNEPGDALGACDDNSVRADATVGAGVSEEEGAPAQMTTLMPGPRISGAACLMDASALRLLGDLWADPLTAPTRESLTSRAAATGLSVVVEPTATVFLDIVVDANGVPCGTNAPKDLAFVPPENLHPAALPATSLSALLGLAGITWAPQAEDPADGPFLSIVTRTQGRRLQCLEEVFTCLAGQSVRDFEILLMCHRVSAEERASLDRVIDSIPGWLQERVRVQHVERPGRAAPLNDGFAAARGRYIAILDDDDTVLSGWVAAFAALEAEAPGRLLRAAAVRQNVVPISVRHRVCALPLGNAVADWPNSFELVDHLRANYSPCMSMAFPRGVFHDLRLRFDEALDITEDWDFLVRTAGIVGTVSTPEVTSVYRWWLDIGSSREAHTKDEWKAAHQRVLDKIDSSVILLPPGSVKKFREVSNEGWEEAAAMATTQHQTNLELIAAAQAHDKAVELWHKAEKKAERAAEQAANRRQKILAQKARFEEQLQLLREVEELRDGARAGGRSAFDLSVPELRVLVDRLSQQSVNEQDKGWRSRLRGKL